MSSKTDAKNSNNKTEYTDSEITAKHNAAFRGVDRYQKNKANLKLLASLRKEFELIQTHTTDHKDKNMLLINAEAKIMLGSLYVYVNEENIDLPKARILLLSGVSFLQKYIDQSLDNEDNVRAFLKEAKKRVTYALMPAKPAVPSVIVKVVPEAKTPEPKESTKKTKAKKRAVIVLTTSSESDAKQALPESNPSTHAAIAKLMPPLLVSVDLKKESLSIPKPLFVQPTIKKSWADLDEEEELEKALEEAHRKAALSGSSPSI